MEIVIRSFQWMVMLCPILPPPTFDPGYRASNHLPLASGSLTSADFGFDLTGAQEVSPVTDWRFFQKQDVTIKTR